LGQALVSRQQAYASDMNRAQHLLAQNNLSSALDILNRHRPLLSVAQTNSNSRFRASVPEQKDLRRWEWRYLWCQGAVKTSHERADLNSKPAILR
jgi:hypothetical protein